DLIKSENLPWDYLEKPGENAMDIGMLFFLALTMCISVRQTDSLWWAVGFHAAFDFGQLFFICPDAPVIGKTVSAGRRMPLQRFMGFPPNRDVTGDLGSMDFLAGQGVGLVCEMKRVGEIVCQLVEEARQVIMQCLPDLAAS